MAFQKLGLLAEFQRAIAAQGCVCRTPVQAWVIPVHVDVAGSAEAPDRARWPGPIARRCSLQGASAPFQKTRVVGHLERIRQQWQTITGFCVLAQR